MIWGAVDRVSGNTRYMNAVNKRQWADNGDVLISLQSNSQADGWVHVQADYHQYSLMHKPDRKNVRGIRDKDYWQEGNHVAGT